MNFNKCVTIGNKILVLQENRPITCYDVDKDEWSEKSSFLPDHVDGFSCVKLPYY